MLHTNLKCYMEWLERGYIVRLYQYMYMHIWIHKSIPRFAFEKWSFVYIVFLIFQAIDWHSNQYWQMNAPMVIVLYKWPGALRKRTELHPPERERLDFLSAHPVPVDGCGAGHSVQVVGGGGRCGHPTTPLGARAWFTTVGRNAIIVDIYFI